MNEFHKRPYVGHPRLSENDNNGKEILLLAKDEEGYCRIYCQMFRMSTCQG
jgi:hypothetical protein